jgi:hypothetical protein
METVDNRSFHGIRKMERCKLTVRVFQFYDCSVQRNNSVDPKISFEPRLYGPILVHDLSAKFAILGIQVIRNGLLGWPDNRHYPHSEIIVERGISRILRVPGFTVPYERHRGGNYLLAIFDMLTSYYGSSILKGKVLAAESASCF